MSQPILVIVGPTGSGKTDVAVRVAQALGGEVVTADSMQVYRGMDIGTAKPTLAEQGGVPHHLIDVVDPDATFTVAMYVAQADTAIAGIVARGHVPIVAGGTGFYIRALVDRGHFPPPPEDHAYRRALAAEAAAHEAGWLHAQLAAVDPATAARLHPNDAQRLIRALEVHHFTGRPVSSYTPWGSSDGEPGAGNDAPYRALTIGLTLPRDVLHARLAARVHAQLAAGLLDEVRRLHEAGYGPELPAMKGITYRQLLGFLRGEYDFPTAIELMVRDNRRYARRQETWFRADSRVEWLDIVALGGSEAAAMHILARWQAWMAQECATLLPPHA